MRPARPKNGRQSLACCESSQAVNWAVVPEPSERTTGRIFSDGSLVPLLSFAIAGSFQLVILFVKIFAMVSPDRRRLRTIFPPTRTW